MAYSGPRLPDSQPIFSPSRGGTTDFQRCPRLFDYTRRWEDPRGWSPDIAMGNILHAWLAADYGRALTRDMILDPRKVAQEVLAKEWSGEGQDEAYETATKVYQEARSVNIFGKTGKVLAVEQEMGPEKCHPDLVISHTSHPTGACQSLSVTADTGGETLEIIDWKFSWHLKPEWVSKRLASYETSWQLKHYAWRVQQEFGLPCTKTTVVQMAATPKPKAWSQSFKVTPESLAAWEASAVIWWEAMDETHIKHFPQNYEGCRKYGENHLCPFYQGCHTLHGDESKFNTLYRRKP